VSGKAHVLKLGLQQVVILRGDPSLRMLLSSMGSFIDEFVLNGPSGGRA
jgi:hypothetical protein